MGCEAQGGKTLVAGAHSRYLLGRHRNGSSDTTDNKPMTADPSLFVNAEGSIIASLSEEQKQAAMATAVDRRVKRGEVLLAHGDPGSTMILLRKGVCKVCRYTAGGKEIILDYVGPGQVVGEISLFDDAPRTASVIAVDPCDVTVFQRRDVLELVSRDPDLALRIIKLLCSRLRKTNALLEGDRSYAMGPKLARGLVRLIDDHGLSVEQAPHLRFPISQGDLGNFVGLSRENVNRQLREWHDDGVLELRSGRIVVLDVDALQDIAGFAD